MTRGGGGIQGSVTDDRGGGEGDKYRTSINSSRQTLLLVSVRGSGKTGGSSSLYRGGF